MRGICPDIWQMFIFNVERDIHRSYTNTDSPIPGESPSPPWRKPEQTRIVDDFYENLR